MNEFNFRVANAAPRASVFEIVRMLGIPRLPISTPIRPSTLMARVLGRRLM